MARKAAVKNRDLFQWGGLWYKYVPSRRGCLDCPLDAAFGRQPYIIKRYGQWARPVCGMHSECHMRCMRGVREYMKDRTYVTGYRLKPVRRPREEEKLQWMARQM